MWGIYLILLHKLLLQSMLRDKNFQKVIIPSAFRHKGLFGTFSLEEHFLQQTFLPNNSTCQTAAGKSQPKCKKAPRASECQCNDKYLKYHKAMERDHRAEICDKREMLAVVDAKRHICHLSQRGLVILGAVTKICSQVTNTQPSKLGKDWHVPVAQPQQAPVSGCVPEPVPDLLCPNTDVPWPLPLEDLSSQKELQLWPFCQTRSVLAERIQADSSPDIPFRCRAVSNCSIHVLHWSKNSKRNILFICFHITDLCSDNSATHRAIHPCSPGWKKVGWCFRTREHHTWVEGCFPLSTWAQVWGGCL